MPKAKSPLQQPEPWNLIAAGYAGASRLFGTFTQGALERVGPLAGARLLDVACGPGDVALEAARQGAEVVAIDFADGMIAQLRGAAADAGLEVDARVMDAERLELPSASFDAGVCLFAFMFFPDRAGAFRELHRVLRDGGKAAVATWAPIARRPLMALGFEALAEALPDLPLPGKGDLQDRDECVAEMTAGGFRDVKCEPLTATLRFADAKAYARLIEETSGPLMLMRRREGEARWAQVHDAFVAAIARRVPSGPFSLDAEALMTWGCRPPAGA